MRLLIRHRDNVWVTYLHDIKELREFISAYLPGRHLTIGDVSLFNSAMRTLLLKFVEENPEVDLYSSFDVVDPILLSRATEVIKEPLTYSRSNSIDQFFESDKSYLSAQSLLASSSIESKLRAHSCSKSLLKVLVSL